MQNDWIVVSNVATGAPDERRIQAGAAGAVRSTTTTTTRGATAPSGTTYGAKRRRVLVGIRAENTTSGGKTKYARNRDARKRG